jgi:hypothetical protein
MNTIPPNDFSYYEVLNNLVQQEPGGCRPGERKEAVCMRGESIERPDLNDREHCTAPRKNGSLSIAKTPMAPLTRFVCAAYRQWPRQNKSRSLNSKSASMSASGMPDSSSRLNEVIEVLQFVRLVPEQIEIDSTQIVVENRVSVTVPVTIKH